MITFYAAIVKSLIGTSDSVTDAITISRIPDLFDDLVQTILLHDLLSIKFLYEVHEYVDICVYTYICI